MLHLPTADSSIRELFDISDLVARNFISLRDAVNLSRKVFNEDSAVRKVTCIILTAGDNVELISFGPKGGRKRVWNFGSIH